MHYKITLLDRNRCYKTSYNYVTVNKVPGLLYWGVCNAEPTGSVPLKSCTTACGAAEKRSIDALILFFFGTIKNNV